MKNESGFTLLELAIVIAIIGLIAGGVIAGRSLIRASEIRNAIGEEDSYVKAIQEFQDKYHALPGDMTNATSLWPGTANGDGSGTIGSVGPIDGVTMPIDTPGTGGIANAGEWFLAWQQLADAGLVGGNFTGTYTGNANAAVPGTNVPTSTLTGAGWTLNYYLNTAGTSLWPDQYGHVLNLGAPVANNYTIGGALRPDNAMSIDQKLDDGMPGTGKVRAWRTGVLPNCTLNDTSQSAQSYNVNDTSKDCALVFLLGL